MPIDLDSFSFDQIWEGHVDIPWLGGLTHIIVDADRNGITPAQNDSISSIKSLPPNTLTALKDALFNEYQNEIYGSITAFRADGTEYDIHDLTPKADNPDDVYSMLSEASVHIPTNDSSQPENSFSVNFECLWDPEHGVAVQFDALGNPMDIAGSGEFY